MPDLNLKGEEEPQEISREREHPGGRRTVWLLMLFGGLVLLVAGVFVLFDSRIFQPEQSEIFPPEPTVTVKLDSGARVSKLADSLVADSVNSQTALQFTRALAESSASPITSGKYTIQLSAWRLEWRAKEEAKRLRGLGLDVYLLKREPDSGGKVWNCIRMGHYQTHEDAKKAAEGFLDTLVVGYTYEKEE